MWHPKFGVLAIALCGLLFGGKADAADLIASGAKVEKLADGFEFVEGPACDAAGNVYFSDIPKSRIHVWSVDGKLSTFRENSGEANGLAFDREGNLVACEGKTRALTSMSPDKKLTVLVDKHNGKKLNSPNDLWIAPNGGVYFSDPRYGNKAGVEQDGHHVYYLPPEKQAAVRVTDNLKRPNGIVGTPDGKRLFITDEGSDKTYVYDIAADGMLTSRKLFTERGSDGMTLDEKGNLYLTNNSVWIHGPDGALLQEIKLPEGAANICFGGKDRKTLFITAQKGLYALHMNATGQ